MKIGIKTFCQTGGRMYGFNYGIKLITDIIKATAGKKITLVDATEHNARELDIIFVSVFWWKHYFDLAEFIIRARIDIEKHKPLVIVGGFQLFNPVPIEDFYHYACIGDGEEWVAEVMPLILSRDFKAIRKVKGTYYKGVDHKVDLRNDRQLNGYVHHENNKVWRVEIASGCKCHCAFCAVSWIKKYQELDYDQIEQVLTEHKKTSWSIFAPNRTFHREYMKVLDCIKRFKINDLASDIRLEHLGKMNVTHKAIGLEGLSERLRRMVGKNFSDEFILKQIKAGHELNQRANKKETLALKLYFILDLPTETRADYEAFNELLVKVSGLPNSDKITLMLHSNIFVANPLTPFQFAGIDRFHHHGKDFRAGVWKDYEQKHKCVVAKQYSLIGAPTRYLQNVTTRGGRNVGVFMRQILFNKKLRPLLNTKSHAKVRTIEEVAKACKIDLDPIFNEGDVSTPYPWDIIRGLYSKKQLYEEYQKCLKRAKK